jgi:uncharacterized protein (TIGR03083 family)
MNRLHATKDFWLAALRADGPALQDAVAEAGPDAVVPACPGWTVADLVEHLTVLLRWVRTSVARGVTTKPDDRVTPPRPDWSEALDGLRRELTGTIETLDALDPEFPAWTWPAQAKKAGFWHRRMAHEISVHRWDAETAAGRPTPIETNLVATDASYEWFVRLRGAGVALLDTGTILDTDDHHPRAGATGTASDLLLVLMGRRMPSVLHVTGDPRLLMALQAA